MNSLNQRRIWLCFLIVMLAVSSVKASDCDVFMNDNHFKLDGLEKSA